MEEINSLIPIVLNMQQTKLALKLPKYSINLKAKT